MEAMDVWEAYANKLGAIPTRNLQGRVQHIDLETFVALGPQYARSDVRLFTAFSFLVEMLIDKIEPNRLSKLFFKEPLVSRDAKLLGCVLERALKGTTNSSLWNEFMLNLANIRDSSDDEVAFNSTPFKPDPFFKSWKLLASAIEWSRPEKYINFEKFRDSDI